MKTIIAALCLMPLIVYGQGARGRGGAGGAGADGEDSPSPTPAQSRIPMWRCDLPGGTYEVAIRSIISVSTHEYVVDGVARVTEMNIETPGNVEVRFYYLEPTVTTTPGGVGQSLIDKAQALANEAAGQVNPGEEPPWEKVVKSYPATTHAHTVEYRLDTEDDVQTLFNSAEKAFRLNQNTEVKVDSPTPAPDSP
jgi:hypothetical protein